MLAAVFCRNMSMSPTASAIVFFSVWLRMLSALREAWGGRGDEGRWQRGVRQMGKFGVCAI